MSKKRGISPSSAIVIRYDSDVLGLKEVGLCKRQRVDICVNTGQDLSEINNNYDGIIVNDEILNEKITSGSSDADLRTTSDQNCKQVKDHLNLGSPSKIRRIQLISEKRCEKMKYGFSRFEKTNDTRNLDRFFISKNVKMVKKRTKASKRRYIKVDEQVSFQVPQFSIQAEKSTNVLENEIQSKDVDAPTPINSTSSEFQSNHMQMKSSDNPFQGKPLKAPLDHDKQSLEKSSDKFDGLESPIKRNEVNTTVQSPMKHESAIELILDLEEEYNINAKAWCEFQLQEEVLHQLQIYLLKKSNKDLCDMLMTELSQMVLSETGSGVIEGPPCTSENANASIASTDSDDSEVILSDDEFFSDDAQLLSSFSTEQKKILEDCWCHWPFPSLPMMNDICLKTGLSSQVVLRWFVERNKIELQFILSSKD